jgi:hypothetical protein
VTPEHGAEHGASAGARAGARGGGGRSTGRLISAGGRQRRAGRRRGCVGARRRQRNGRALVKMKRRAGRIRVKTPYLRRLCTRPSEITTISERRLWPSEITLSPTASYRAVGDKEAVGCLLVYCSAWSQPRNAMTNPMTPRPTLPTPPNSPDASYHHDAYNLD